MHIILLLLFQFNRTIHISIVEELGDLVSLLVIFVFSGNAFCVNWLQCTCLVNHVNKQCNDDEATSMISHLMNDYFTETGADLNKYKVLYNNNFFPFSKQLKIAFVLHNIVLLIK